MKPILSREQVRAVDARAIAAGVPGIVLMENAGRGAAEQLASLRDPFVIVCGPGNNGGDGFVVARHLVRMGRRATVLATRAGDDLKGDARLAHDAWRAVGGDVTVVGVDEGIAGVGRHLAEAGTIVDALLGTGLDRPVGAGLAGLIEAINEAPAPVVALDLPSGLNPATGQPLGVAISAVRTLSFAALKLGLMTPRGRRQAGEVRVVDIGLPRADVAAAGVAAWLLEAADVGAWLAPRPVDVHKGTAGRVLVVGGCAGTTGAPLLSARAALRSGAGLVTLATRPDAVAAIAARSLEVMTAVMDGDDPASLEALTARAGALVVGPGLGTDRVARKIVRHLLVSAERPMVVDADAITLLAEEPGVLRGAPGARILTPHPAELGRILGSSAADVEADRFGALAAAVSATDAVVLLKGPHTLIGAPGVAPLVNDSGTPALATAGSGDVLAGLVGTLAVQLPAREAAAAGAFLHGLAAERWAARSRADRGLLASELADELTGALADLVAARVAGSQPLLPD